MQVSINTDRIGSVMDNVWFESRPGQTKDYRICMCYFSARHASSRRKSKYWFARKQDSVSESYHYKNRTKRVGLVQSGPHHLNIHWK